MPRILEAEVFSAASCEAVADFFCGSEPWQLAISDWIKAPPGDSSGALWSIEHRKTKVWLYYEGDSLVGYGSLGISNWSWPYPDGAKKKVSIIPCLGLNAAFHGEPKDAPSNERFSSQVIKHLTYEAARQGLEFLVLKVHCENGRATKVYERFGFERFPVLEGEYVRMYKRILAGDVGESARQV